MKLGHVLCELKGGTTQYASKFRPGYSSASSWGIKGYRTTPGNKFDDPVSQTLDPYIEEQLIDQVIDVMYRDYPEMVGKVMVGEVRDIIDIDRFIKRLKKRMKVETL
jgi:hypothetical protein